MSVRKIKVKKEANFSNREIKRRKRKKTMWKNGICVTKKENNDEEISTRGRKDEEYIADVAGN